MVMGSEREMKSVTAEVHRSAVDGSEAQCSGFVFFENVCRDVDVDPPSSKQSHTHARTHACTHAHTHTHTYTHTHLHPIRSVETRAAMPLPAPLRGGPNVSLAPAALTASLLIMVPHVGELPMSVTSWSTALGTPLSVLLTSTGRTGASATTIGPSVSQGFAGVVMTSVGLTLAQVCPQ